MLASLFANGPLRLGDLLDASFRILRLRFGTFVLLAGLFAVFAAAIEYVGVVTGTGSILNILVRVLSIWQGATLLCFIFALLGDAPLTAGASLGAGTHNFWRMFGVSFLQGLGMVGAAIPGSLVLVVIMAGFTPGSASSAVLGIVGLLAASLLVAVPVFYLATRWCVSTQALIGEGCGVGEALSRSWSLTSGRFWRCFGYVLLVGLLSMVFLWLPIMVGGGFIAAAPSIWADWVTAGTFALSALLGALWVPFSLTAFSLLYYDLRVRGESLDLELRTAQLERNVAPPPESAPGTDMPF